MRYVFLLLILCISFGVLDSVSRHNTSFTASAPGIAAPPFHTARPVANDNLFHNATLAHGSAVAPDMAGDPGMVSLTRKGGLSVLTSGLHSLAHVSRQRTHAVHRAHSNFSANEGIPAGVQLLATGPEQSNAGTSSVRSDKSGGSEAGMGAIVRLTAAEDITAPESGSDAVAAGEITPDLSTGNETLARSPLPDMADQGLDRLARLAKDQTLMALKATSIENSLMDPHGVQVGGVAGLNWSGASVKGSSGKVTGKPLTGFSLGLFADIPLKKHLSLRPTVKYSYEGYQPLVGGAPVNIHVASLNTALNFVYHTHLVKDRFFVGAGPYLAGNITGTYSLKGINTDMSFGNNYGEGDNLRKLDYGASMTAGLLMDRNFVLGAGFDLGLRNISPQGFNTQIRTRNFGVSLMYVFRNKAIF